MSHEDTTDNSAIPSSSYSQDLNDLKDLKLQDSDIDDFASYFEVAFEGSTRSMTVLVALLQRLRAVENFRKQKQTGIWIEDIVCRLTHRLYAKCGAGLEAACCFGSEASDATERIFAEAQRGSQQLVGVALRGHPSVD